jgi:hypothetical protein
MDDTELGEETKRKIAMEKVCSLSHCAPLFFNIIHMFYFKALQVVICTLFYRLDKNM